MCAGHGVGLRLCSASGRKELRTPDDRKPHAEAEGPQGEGLGEGRVGQAHPGLGNQGRLPGEKGGAETSILSEYMSFRHRGRSEVEGVGSMRVQGRHSPERRAAGHA